MSHLYYKLKPYIPRSLQIALRRRVALFKRPFHKNVWPIDPRCSVLPEGWRGWPDGKQFAFVLTHDVETAKGVQLVPDLMKLEQSFGFRSCFNFVAGDYVVPDGLLDHIRGCGFEIGVHGLHHRGNLFSTYEHFLEHARGINAFLHKWRAVGFRTPSMFHNLDWIHHLNIEYDSSTFDTDPFEPQSDGAGTIFPFWVSGGKSHKGYVELPYTLAQDFTIFVIMGEKTTELWKRKTRWLAEQGGMVLANVHPDYMNFGNHECSIDEFPMDLYQGFLSWVRDTYEDSYWHALPREVALFFPQERLEIMQGAEAG